jgi:uncharacterized protein (TIGR00288 family)
MENHRQNNIALFIDCDNVSAKFTESVFDDLSQYGKINIRKAYGNWKDPKLIGWENILQNYNIQPYQQFAYTQNKNASDIAIVIDIMDALYTKEIDAIALITSDSDFTPIVTRILADGKTVYGYGEEKTPKALVRACSQFIYVEKLNELDKPEEDDASSEEVKSRYKGSNYDARKDYKLKKFLTQAVEVTAKDDGWADLKDVGHYISRNTSFSPINHGFKKLGTLVKHLDIFDVKYTKNHLAMLVRTKEP